MVEGPRQSTLAEWDMSPRYVNGGAHGLYWGGFDSPECRCEPISYSAHIPMVEDRVGSGSSVADAMGALGRTLGGIRLSRVPR